MDNVCDASDKLMAIDEPEKVVIKIGGVNELPLMTALGLIGGDVLSHLEDHGSTEIEALNRHINWPNSMILMSVGALIRQGLVRATRNGLKIQLDLLG